MSAIKNLLAFIKKILLTGQKITDNVEDAIELVDTKLTELDQICIDFKGVYYGKIKL